MKSSGDNEPPAFEIAAMKVTTVKTSNVPTHIKERERGERRATKIGAKPQNPPPPPPPPPTAGRTGR